MNKKILVAVIAYNEEENIVNTLNDLRDNCKYDIDIVVIDDGSRDQTAELARQQGVEVISHCTNIQNAMSTVSTYFRTPTGMVTMCYVSLMETGSIELMPLT